MKMQNPTKCRVFAFRIVATVYGAVKKLGGGPSPSGRGRRDSLIEAGAPGEGRALRPLPEGEGETSAITILHSPYDRRQSGNYEIVGGHRPPLQSPSRTLLLAMWLLIGPALVAAQGLDPASLLKPLSDSWPTYSGDYSGRRHSSLIRMNQSHV